jgi:hypothetical protein
VLDSFAGIVHAVRAELMVISTSISPRNASISR